MDHRTERRLATLENNQQVPSQTQPTRDAFRALEGRAADLETAFLATFTALAVVNTPRQTTNVSRPPQSHLRGWMTYGRLLRGTMLMSCTPSRSTC